MKARLIVEPGGVRLFLKPRGQRGPWRGCKEGGGAADAVSGGAAREGLPAGWSRVEHISSGGVRYRRYCGPGGQKARLVARELEGERRVDEDGRRAALQPPPTALRPPRL